MTQSRNITNATVQIADSLPLARDEVQVWRVDLQVLGGDEGRWRERLSEDELARAARFYFSRDRQHYIAGRAMLRTILGRYLDADPKKLVFRYSKKDKPSLDFRNSDATNASENITFNVSHSAGVALLAFGRGREVGIDVEHIRQDFDPSAIARRFFSEYEQKELSAVSSQAKVEAFFRCWTRKEAYIKATGDGLSLPLSEFDVSLLPGEMNALLATRPEASEAQRWLLREVAAGEGYLAALCASGRDWKANGWWDEAGA
jgi:4'-phosphopantetheinyl transferase